MKNILSVFFWISVYLLLVLSPLLVLMTGEMPLGSGFWWDFSMALGFAGMGMIGIQFLLTARFRRISAPFGIDIIYYFHRYLAVMAFVFIFLHFLIIRIDNVDALGAINPLQDQLGYKNAINMSGGIKAWRKAGYPVADSPK